jgi:iron complex transport system substrate-binding protein
MKKSVFISILCFSAFLFQPNTEAGPAKRYISLAPATTEILFSLGLEEEIVGVSSYCDYPQAALSKEKVGDFSRPDTEKILFLKPDYVFCAGLEQAAVALQLKRLNLNVYVSDPANIEELFDSILTIGKITARQTYARNVVEDMKNRIKKITTKSASIPKEKQKKVFVEIWHDPLFTAGCGSFIDELISLAGGINIAYDTKRPYSIFSWEEVISRNPDCIFVAYMSEKSPLELIKKRPGWANLAAVKNNRVYTDIDPNMLLRPGPRLAQGLEELYKRLYPGQ